MGQRWSKHSGYQEKGKVNAISEYTTMVIVIRLHPKNVLILWLHKHTWPYFSPNIKTNPVFLPYTIGSASCALEGSRCHNLLSHMLSSGRKREGTRREKGQSRKPHANNKHKLKGHEGRWGSLVEAWTQHQKVWIKYRVHPRVTTTQIQTGFLITVIRRNRTDLFMRFSHTKQKISKLLR